jgi:hypothetical protein
MNKEERSQKQVKAEFTHEEHEKIKLKLSGSSVNSLIRSLVLDWLKN